MSHTIYVTRIILRPLSALFGLQCMLPMEKSVTFTFDSHLVTKRINFIYKTTDIYSIFNADLSFSRNNFLFFSLNCQKMFHNIYLTVKFTNKIHPPPLFVVNCFLNDPHCSYLLIYARTNRHLRKV